MSFFASRLAAAAQNSQQQQQQAPPPPLNPPPQQYTAPAQPLQAVPSAPQPQPESAAVVSPQQAAQHQTTAPPWAKPDCAACGGRGFSSAGYACRICDAKAPEEGRPKSAQFIISVNGNGELTWRPREGTEGPQGSAPAPSAAVPIQSQERVQHSVPEPAPAPAIAPAPAPAIAPAPAPAIAPEPAPASAIAPAPAPAHREEPPQGNKVDIENVPASLKDTHNRKGRPKRSFILCVNCTPISGQEKIGTGRGVHYLHKVLEDISQVLVQEAQKTDPRIQHPSEVDVWQRRDFYARAGAQIAEDFGTDIVVADGIGVGSSDLRTLFDAIRPYAGMEIHTSGMIH